MSVLLLNLQTADHDKILSDVIEIVENAATNSSATHDYNDTTYMSRLSYVVFGALVGVAAIMYFKK